MCSLACMATDLQAITPIPQRQNFDPRLVQSHLIMDRDGRATSLTMASKGAYIPPGEQTWNQCLK